MANEYVNWTIMVYISADNVLANFAVESLKQLRDAAGDGISVVAEFDDNQHDDARMYYFDGNKRNLPIESSRIPEREIAHLKTIRRVDMTRPDTLTEFIDYAAGKSKTECYCLVLWGHGIELLLDEQRRFGSTEQAIRRYLSIGDLKKALQGTKLVNGQLARDHPKTIFDQQRSETEKKSGLDLVRTNPPIGTTGDRRPELGKRQTLDIIGLDACSMSMVELVSELQDCVNFVIASQEDVPDASFPYQKILSGLKSQNVRNDVREVCKLVPGLYQEAFRDYIASPDTGVKGITLTSLDVAKTKDITDPLMELASALLTASQNEALREKIFRARERSKSFVFGLLVDLGDFCQRLESQLTVVGSEADDLRRVCGEILDAITVPVNGLVLENKADEDRCHGLSIYFPYRNDDETDNAEEQFAKGGSRQPLKGGSRQPLKERTARIRELEADFAKLDVFRRTGWNDFIKQGWSSILANKTPFELDQHYSAEQVAQNLLSCGRWPPMAAKAS